MKFQNNPKHRRILVNELLGTRLAGRLGLPTAPVSVVEVPGELIRLTPELCVEMPRSRIPCLPGLQFGSRYAVCGRSAAGDAALRGLYAPNRVYEGVIGMESFAPWLERLERQIGGRVLAEEVPPAWYEDDYDALSNVLQLAPQKGVYADHLAAQRLGARRAR